MRLTLPQDQASRCFQSVFAATLKGTGQTGEIQRHIKLSLPPMCLIYRKPLYKIRRNMKSTNHAQAITELNHQPSDRRRNSGWIERLEQTRQRIALAEDDVSHWTNGGRCPQRA